MARRAGSQLASEAEDEQQHQDRAKVEQVGGARCRRAGAAEQPPVVSASEAVPSAAARRRRARGPGAPPGAARRRSRRRAPCGCRSPGCAGRRCRPSRRRRRPSRAAERHRGEQAEEQGAHRARAAIELASTCSMVRRSDSGWSRSTAQTASRTGRARVAGSASLRSSRVMKGEPYCGRGSRPGRSTASSSASCRTVPTTPTTVRPAAARLGRLQVDALAERVLARPEARREALVDAPRRPPRARRVGGGEDPAAAQGDLQGAEIARARPRCRSTSAGPAGARVAALDGDGAGQVEAAERQGGDGARGAHAGHRRRGAAAARGRRPGPGRARGTWPWAAGSGR